MDSSFQLVALLQSTPLLSTETPNTFLNQRNLTQTGFCLKTARGVTLTPIFLSALAQETALVGKKQAYKNFFKVFLSQDKSLH
jgi:hypothetical protein